MKTKLYGFKVLGLRLLDYNSVRVLTYFAGCIFPNCFWI